MFESNSPQMDGPLDAIKEEESSLRKSDETIPTEGKDEEEQKTVVPPIDDKPKLDDYEILKADVAAGSFGSISIAMSKKKGIKVALKKMDAERIQ